MKPKFHKGNVQAQCDACEGAVTTFEYKESNREFGNIIIDVHHTYQGGGFSRTVYLLLKCAGCGKGGLAKIHDNGNIQGGCLELFFPICITRAKIPKDVPDGIAAEYREAEICMSAGAWRGASALLRSTLEKTLKANGYTGGMLANKINEAAGDGIITESRRKRAYDDIKVLGNDVLHDEWREIEEEEVETSHHYVQRILEDFYDDRKSVEDILTAKGRMEAQPLETAEAGAS